MCGIGGVHRIGVRPIEQEQITSLLLQLEHRGGDACGVVLVADDEATPMVLKAAETAPKFCATKAYKDFLDANLSAKTRTVLVHTRKWTTGTPTKNENNHPMFAGKSAVVHNGIIWNHEELFSRLKLKRKAETDSDILRAITDEYGLTRKAIRELEKTRGMATCCFVHKAYPGCVLLTKSGSPLELAVSSSHIYWASTRKAINVASKIWRKVHGVWVQVPAKDLAFAVFPPDTAWMFDVNGYQWHQEFSMSHLMGNYVNPQGAWWDDKGGEKSTTRALTNYAKGTTYSTKKCNYSYLCANASCGKRNAISEDDLDKDVRTLKCYACKKPLIGATQIISIA